MGDNSEGVFVLPGEPVSSTFFAGDLPSGMQLSWVTPGPSATLVFTEDNWPFSDSYPSGGIITVPASGNSSRTISTTASGSYSYAITCSGKTASGTVKVENPLAYVRLDPTSASIAVDNGESFLAYAVYESGGILALNQEANVAWNSSDSSVATISGSGYATGVDAGGPVTISVQYSGVTGTASLTVTSA